MRWRMPRNYANYVSKTLDYFDTQDFFPINLLIKQNNKKKKCFLFLLIQVIIKDFLMRYMSHTH